MLSTLSNIRRWPASTTLRVFALVAALALAAAYVLEYGFGFVPCQMCLWERVPYVMVLGIGLVGSFLVNIAPLRKLSFVALSLTLLVLVTLSAYHVGVESGWAPALEGCVAEVGVNDNLEDMKAAILNAPLVTCDQTTAVFFGQTLAAWNFLLALGLSLWSLAAMHLYWNKPTVAQKTYW